MGINQTIVPRESGQHALVQAPTLCGSEADALEAALNDMSAAFFSDFVGGGIGKRHNTFEHRSRVLRQMTGRLASIRALDAVAAS